MKKAFFKEKIKDKSKIINIIFSVCVFALLCVSIYGYGIDAAFSLDGVTNSSEIEHNTFNDYWTGQAQNEVEQKYNNEFGGRTFFIRLRNQTMYSVFNKSSNKYVLMGKDKCLFEHAYVERELAITRAPNEDIDKNIQMLEQLNDILKQQNKELYIFITPSKAHYCYDKIPDEYFVMPKVDEQNDYDYFINRIAKTNLSYFDSRQYIDEYGSTLEAPSFYKTGIHWSYSHAYLCTKGFLDMANEKSKFDLGNFSFKEHKTDDPLHPDADLYLTLNLLNKPRGQYYVPEMVIERQGDKPKVFMRGGSFMGSSINHLLRYGILDGTVYFENTNMFQNPCTSAQTYQSITNYDQYVDLKDDLAKSDIVMLEINEAAIHKMTFGFAEYLVTHKELFE